MLVIWWGFQHRKKDGKSGTKNKKLEHKVGSGYGNRADPQTFQCGGKVKAKFKVGEKEC